MMDIGKKQFILDLVVEVMKEQDKDKLYLILERELDQSYKDGFEEGHQ